MPLLTQFLKKLRFSNRSSLHFRKCFIPEMVSRFEQIRNIFLPLSRDFFLFKHDLLSVLFMVILMLFLFFPVLVFSLLSSVWFRPHLYSSTFVVIVFLFYKMLQLETIFLFRILLLTIGAVRLKNNYYCPYHCKPQLKLLFSNVVLWGMWEQGYYVHIFILQVFQKSRRCTLVLAILSRRHETDSFWSGNERTRQHWWKTMGRDSFGSWINTWIIAILCNAILFNAYFKHRTNRVFVWDSKKFFAVTYTYIRIWCVP